MHVVFENEEQNIEFLTLRIQFVALKEKMPYIGNFEPPANPFTNIRHCTLSPSKH